MSVNIYRNGQLNSIEKASMSIATEENTGIVKPDGDTITIDNDGTIHGADSTPIATEEIAGKVKPDGTSITVDNDGTIHGKGSAEFVGTLEEVEEAFDDIEEGATIYVTDGGGSTLPLATTTRTGIVKPDGSTITIDNDGTIHSAGGSGSETPIATTIIAGKVRPDGSTITIEEDGTIHGVDATPIATSEIAGKVRPDGNTITITGSGTISATAQTPAIATTSTAGIVKPDGTFLKMGDAGLLNFDPNLIKLDRNKLMPWNQPVRRVIQSQSVSSSASLSESFYTVSIESGLYYISFAGYIETTVDKTLFAVAWINLNNNTDYNDEKAYISARGGVKSKGFIPLNASGLMILKTGDKLYFSQDWLEWNSQTFNSFQGVISLYCVYELNQNFTGTQWWNNTTLPTN